MSQRHWVLIETGGNQRYIFGSSRMRHVVGASYLVHQVGERWVCQAAERLGAAHTVVMTASGKALLVVESWDQGQAVIRAVTERALSEAPGLRVTGVIGDAFDATDPAAHAKALRAAHETQARARAARPDLALRDRVFPWHQLCRFSGEPAKNVERYGEETPVPASAAVLARSQVREAAYKRLVMKLGPALAEVVPEHLDVIAHSGWMAIVHADGNGVGALFRDFIEHVRVAEGTDEVSLDTHIEYQRDCAEELDQATWMAVTDAITALKDRYPMADRLLPIVVGGDDVTIACDAALAVGFVREFAEAFAARTAERPRLSAICQAATGRRGLTASAGIAVVKPHHPFATAYELAEELTVSAKRVRPGDASVGAFDLYVAHTSTLRELAELREYAYCEGRPPVARHAGPYLLAEPAALPEALRGRSVVWLDEMIGCLAASGPLSATQAHAIREAADRGLTEYLHQVQLTLGRVDRERRTRLSELLAVQDGVDDQPPFLRLFDALHLRGLRLAEVANNDGSP